MKFKHTLAVVYYGLLIMILHGSRQPYITILSFILLIRPFLDIINSTLNLNFGLFFKEDRVSILGEKRTNRSMLPLEIILFTSSLIILALITWYTFTYKIIL